MDDYDREAASQVVSKSQSRDRSRRRPPGCLLPTEDDGLYTVRQIVIAEWPAVPALRRRNQEPQPRCYRVRTLAGSWDWLVDPARQRIATTGGSTDSSSSRARCEKS